jgi:hypothetical protein
VRGRGLDSSNGCVGFHNIVAVKGGADADSEVDFSFMLYLVLILIIL